jgi:Tol biopolymer transport system component
MRKVGVGGAALSIILAGSVLATESLVVLKMSAGAQARYERLARVLSKRAEYLSAKGLTLTRRGEELDVRFESAPQPEAVAKSLSAKGSVQLWLLPEKNFGYVDETGKLSLTIAEKVKRDAAGVIWMGGKLKSATEAEFLAGASVLYSEKEFAPNSAVFERPAGYFITVELNAAASKDFRVKSAASVHRGVALTVDGKLISCANILGETYDGRITFYVGANEHLARATAAMIESGPLPGEVERISAKLGDALGDYPGDPLAELPAFCVQSAGYTEVNFAESGEKAALAFPKGAIEAMPSPFPAADIIVADLMAGRMEKTIMSSSANSAPQVSNDGTVVLFLSFRDDTNGDGKIDERDAYAVYLRTGEKERVVAKAQETPRTFLMSADGSAIAFTRVLGDTNKDGKRDAQDAAQMVYQKASGEMLYESAKEADEWPLALSKDGKKLVYARFPHGKAGNYAILLRDGERDVTVSPADRANAYLGFNESFTLLYFTVASKDSDGNGAIDYRDRAALAVYEIKSGATRVVKEAGESFAVVAFGHNDPVFVLTQRRKLASGEMSPKPEYRVLAEKEVVLVSSDSEVSQTLVVPGDKQLVLCQAMDTNNDKTLDESDRRVISLYGIDGKKIRDLTSVEHSASILGVARNRCVFSSARKDTSGDGAVGVGDVVGLYCVDLDTGSERLLISDDYAWSFLGCSPDGKRFLVLVRDRDTDGDEKITPADRWFLRIIDDNGKTLVEQMMVGWSA